MKIKFNTTLIAILATLFLVGPSFVASGDELPIYSPDVARNAMLSISVQGSVYYESASTDWSYPATAYYTNVIGTNAEDVLTKLSAFKFNLRIENSNDDIQGYEYIGDAAGNTLFYGYVTFAQSNTAPIFQLYLENVVLFSGQGVSNATVLALNPDGTTANQTSLTIQNGEVLLPWWMTGATNGLMVVNNSDGTLSSYPLFQPTPETVGDVTGDAGFKIQGHYVFKNPTNVQIVEAYYLPTAYVQVTSPVAAVNGTIWDVTGLVQTSDGGTYFDRPLSMVATIEGTSISYTFNFSATGPTKVVLPISTYRTRFIWARFGTPETLYTGSYVTVGKG